MNKIKTLVSENIISTIVLMVALISLTVFALDRFYSLGLHEEEIVLYEDSPNLQNKELLADGSVRYTMNSPFTNRPNIITVIGKEQNHVFERSVISQEGMPILLSDYLAFFGQPEQTIKGSRFYGPEAQTYIYAGNGRSFIANPQTNLVMELHTFAPMTVDEYIGKYGEDLLLSN